MNLGIHASVRKGFLSALKECANLQCKTVQIFPRRPRNPLLIPTELERDTLLQFRKDHSIYPLIVHSVFQPNIASTNQKILERSRRSFLDELKFVEGIQADYLVIHSGNYSPDSNLNEGIRISAESILWALSEVNPRSRILIENVGGGERRMGGKFEELKELLNAINHPEQMGICFDTAHCFSAGYDISTQKGLEECLTIFDKVIGLGQIHCFHMNDSGVRVGTHKDIHEHIGKGWIGQEPLNRLSQDSRFETIPGIIETPKFPAGSDKENLSKLKS